MPLLLLGLYLIRDTRSVLIEQAKTSERQSIQVAEQTLVESLDTGTSILQSFAFDTELQAIAERDYPTYQAWVEDYRNYSNFQRIKTLYPRTVQDISFYVENPTLRGNRYFVNLTQTVKQEPWFESIAESLEPFHLRWMPEQPFMRYGLAMTRNLHSIAGKRIGTMVLHLERSLLPGLLGQMPMHSYVTIGDELVLTNQGAHATSDILPDAMVLELLDLKASAPLSNLQRNFYQSSRYQDTIQYRGETYLVSKVQLRTNESDPPIVISSVLPYRSILSSVHNQSRTSILIYLVSAFLTLLAIGFISWVFSKRLKDFGDAMTLASRGVHDTTLEDTGDELSQLYTHLEHILSREQALAEQVRTAEISQERMKLEKRTAEYRALALQINPHFLYNTLETVRLKARMSGEKDIERITISLARMLRYTLSNQDQLVPLSEELRMIENYVEIQTFRFGARFQFELQVPEALMSEWLPPFVLQPLVENALQHGIGPKIEGGKVILRADDERDAIRISVIDDGVGMDTRVLEKVRAFIQNDDGQSQDHIGMVNVHRRLLLQYGTVSGLEIESEPDQGTTVRFLIPKEPGGSMR